jgi:hypothetical protein
MVTFSGLSLWTETWYFLYSSNVSGVALAGTSSVYHQFPTLALEMRTHSESMFLILLNAISGLTLS